MKRIAFALSALLLSITLAAQTTQEEFQKRYELLSGRLGPGGVGIETPSIHIILASAQARRL